MSDRSSEGDPSGALDYRTYGRQIALPELGAAGQLALARIPVRFVGDDRALARSAAEIHARAGGVVRDDARVAVALPARIPPGNDAAHHAAAAWAAVEAARRVLAAAGLGEYAPAAEMPPALRDRLTEGLPR